MCNINFQVETYYMNLSSVLVEVLVRYAIRIAKQLHNYKQFGQETVSGHLS